MKISVHAKPNAHKTLVEKTGEGEYTVSIMEPAREGKANEAVLKAIAAHFDVPRSRVRLVSGHTFHRKIVEVI